MELVAKLTTGWPAWAARKRLPNDALNLHKTATEAVANGGNYTTVLQQQLQGLETHEILGLDHFFRKSTAGAKPIKKLVSALSALSAWCKSG